LATN
jgi:hypothetical protein